MRYIKHLFVRSFYQCAAPAQHSFSGDDGSVLATDTIGKQVTAPSVAISNDVKAEQVLADSLARVNHKVQVINE